ncbi:MAG: ABC-type transport auxiliary lipoprotein family protein [Syntrophobacteraceae bacterium]
MRHLLTLSLFVFVLTGCASYFSSGSPPQYYEIDYAAPPSDCGSGWREGVRVWPFSASAPYDREEMIILDADHKVRFSSVYRWVAVPGVMVADRLLQDLGRSRLFAGATAPVNRLASALELSGHIHRFAWEEGGSGNNSAVLEVEVSLWQEDPKRDVLFRRHYRFESPPFPSGSPESMAEALSRLVREVSDSLQRDLCAMRPGS